MSRRTTTTLAGEGPSPWGNDNNPGTSSSAAATTSNKPPIVPTAHDILSGRGVNIAQHAGNERFRTLINSHYDPNYCTQYSTSEKRAVAQEIIAHIRSLDPPGRFLKRSGRSNNYRGLEGPWEELTEQQMIKKTCQALRDCNRQDRTGYAATVTVPEDVRQSAALRSQTGMTNKEYAEQAAVAREQQVQLLKEEIAQTSRRSTKRTSSMEHLVLGAATSTTPADEQGGSWLKRQRLSQDVTPAPNSTPTTAATSGGTLQQETISLLGSVDSSAPSYHHMPDPAHSVFLGAEHTNMPPSPPAAAGFHDTLGSAFHDAFTTSGGEATNAPIASDPLDPLQLAAAAIDTANDDSFHHHHHHQSTVVPGLTVPCQDPLSIGDDHVDDFPPPSPLHPGDSALAPDRYDD